MATALVTGANRGIGLSLVKALVARGDDVIAACRHTSPELEALGVRVEKLDVTDEASLRDLARQVHGELDLLINNAGLLKRDGFNDLDVASIRTQFEVNALGPLRVTQALRHKLQDGAKVVIVTSRMGSIGDNTSGSMYGYRMSKAAVNMAGRSLAHDLRPRGVSVVLLHPGFVRTGMTGGRGDWGPDAAAAAMVARIDELDMSTSGSLLHANGEPLPW